MIHALWHSLNQFFIVLYALMRSILEVFVISSDCWYLLLFFTFHGQFHRLTFGMSFKLNTIKYLHRLKVHGVEVSSVFYCMLYFFIDLGRFSYENIISGRQEVCFLLQNMVKLIFVVCSSCKCLIHAKKFNVFTKS